MKILPFSLFSILALSALSLFAQAPEGYVLDWADEFDYTGAPDPEFWTHETGGGGWGNNEVQIYTDSLENSRVEDGKLIIEVHQETGSRVPNYTSARLITREKVQWKYGRMEIRAKLPSETGTWPAIWLLAADRLYGNGGWPDNGEIDIMEHVGYEEDPLFRDLQDNQEIPNIHGTTHTFNRNGLFNSGMGDSTFVADASSAFHTYAITWREGYIEWEVDGVVYLVQEEPTFRNPPENPYQFWPFDQRFFMILNVAIGGNWGGHFSTGRYPDVSPYGRGIDETETAVWPQRMEVDYVRVYQADVPPPATAVPGTVLATDLDQGNGILIEQSGNVDFPHKLTNIGADDTAEFVIDAPEAGIYTVRATVATPSNNHQLTIGIPETGGVGVNASVPNTGDYEIWQSMEIGNVDLQSGSNTLTLSTTTGGFELAAFDVAVAEGLTWKGFPVDGTGKADTGPLLGVINVNAAPWIFSYSLNRYIFMPMALEEVFVADSQWVYVPK